MERIRYLEKQIEAWPDWKKSVAYCLASDLASDVEYQPIINNDEIETIVRTNTISLNNKEII